MPPTKVVYVIAVTDGATFHSILDLLTGKDAAELAAVLEKTKSVERQAQQIAQVSSSASSPPVGPGVETIARPEFGGPRSPGS